MDAGQERILIDSLPTANLFGDPLQDLGKEQIF